MEDLCYAKGDGNGSTNDSDAGTCAATVFLLEGDTISLLYDGSTDSTPLGPFSGLPYSGFTGFKIG